MPFGVGCSSSGVVESARLIMHPVSAATMVWLMLGIGLVDVACLS